METIIIDHDKLRKLVGEKAGLTSKKDVAKQIGMNYQNFVRWYNGTEVGLTQLKLINQWLNK